MLDPHIVAPIMFILMISIFGSLSMYLFAFAISTMWRWNLRYSKLIAFACACSFLIIYWIVVAKQGVYI